VNWSAEEVALVPPGLVTVTSTVPNACPGEVTEIVSAETVRMVAYVVPNWTAEVPRKPLPLIVTVSPPAVDPLVGEIPVTVGPI